MLMIPVPPSFEKKSRKKIPPVYSIPVGPFFLLRWMGFFSVCA